MPRPHLFLDSSVFVAGVISSTGAARALLLLAAGDQLDITISEQVVAETERSITKKAARALPYYRTAVKRNKLRIISDPLEDELDQYEDIISDPTDIPIVVAAMKAQVDYLVTLNRRHFIDDPQVAVRSGLRIGTPGDALAWVRQELAQIGQ
jgi:predicted nucleic acid-binding protein